MEFDKRIELYKTVLGTPLGAELLKDLQKVCFADQSTYCPMDTHGSAYKEGVRSVYLMISRFMNMSDDQLKLIKEQNNERTDN